MWFFRVSCDSSVNIVVEWQEDISDKIKVKAAPTLYITLRESACLL